MTYNQFYNDILTAHALHPRHANPGATPGLPLNPGVTPDFGQTRELLPGLDDDTRREKVNPGTTPGFEQQAAAEQVLTQIGVNASCGDRLQFWVSVDEDKVIKQITFAGEGCMISRASADIAAEILTGQKVAGAQTLIANFVAMIRGAASEAQMATLGEAVALADIQNSPARVKCATLAWHTLEQILTGVI
ncbi:SUF system NifU family Fe-S cluster assembly protein [bacterium]|nr:SUF system NifU family Fe-S cluster assembly protein [bacterium]